MIKPLSFRLWACLVAPVSLAMAAPDYTKDIKPLLKERCVSCHGSVKQKGDLRLDAGALIDKGVHAELVERVTSHDEDERMPPEGARLTESQVEALRLWIAAGAPFPSDEVIPKKPSEHWSFQPVKRPKVPESASHHPIDAFVFGKQNSTPQAAPMALLRRVYLDLIGLPPTIAEQERHSSLDTAIDDLLTRPEYGERWARHWLDVVRYADSNGYERDAEKPFVWHYRDYVIEALNNDKPFDRFVMEQLAGDEMKAESGKLKAEMVIATGFLRLGHWDDEPADPAADRYDQLDDIVSTTGQAFLGLTIGCARCHDHKFEPLATRDYYSLVAVFNPLQRPTKGRTELTVPVDGTEVYIWREPSAKAPETHVLVRGSPTRFGDLVEPAVPAILVKQQPQFPSGEKTTQRRLGLAQWIASTNNPLTARVIVNRVWQQHFGQGLVTTANDFGLMGAAPSHPELLDWLAHWFMHDAKWSLKKLHRLILTSRAWQSRSEGQRAKGTGTKPANATPKSDSVSLHYALSPTPYRYRRLEVEAIRDSMLAVSGQLNPKRFGPAMKPGIPAAALEANTDKEKVWQASDEREASRRSIYAFIKRGLVVPMLETLDLADTVSSCPQRQVTTVAPQALSLFNGDFVNQQAKRFAARLKREAGDDSAKQITLAWRLALCREPTAAELTQMHRFLREESLEQVCRVILNLNEFVYPE
ncbi:PSD1 and planctomycete cytochrome C domain-containing protein [Prosthecobacter sp.]|uniref:PSD1 and planctomycete cytochrome C domain-containing protein n=1 Tax=Prosthecobacter sp. TaxID=1965333 RepID=UPI002AB9E7A8|nr:PSD1 and planctomycete cytochrome C domain-containing protein [Prosthecobacter sp.]MDZ4406044.1 PSD1 and planctomycete cytochrome C domain-containing protein [Prosthecobacter sp.]